MSPPFRRTLLAGLVLVLSGMARLPFEQSLTHSLRAQELLAAPLPLDTRQKLGQGLLATSLGGLRSLVAGILHLRAFGFFEDKRWGAMAETFDTIVQLAPHTAFYWDNGHWMMAYNAASYYANNYAESAPARARAEEQRWIEKGRDFLEEGVRLNRDRPELWAELGSFYSNPRKILDYDKAADAYKRAAELPGALPYMRRFQAYAMARSPRLIDQALPLVRKLRELPGGSVPTLVCLQFSLECRANPGIDPAATAISLFGGEEKAFRTLSNYYLDSESNFPPDGVEEALQGLLGPLREKLQQLVRDPAKHDEALDLARTLQEGYGGTLAPVPALRLALELEANPALRQPDKMFEGWFDTAEDAREALRAYLHAPPAGFPVNGLENVLRMLEK